MAYLSFPEFGGAAFVRESDCGPVADRVPGDAAGLTAVEWTVVRIARKDRMSSLRQPGRLTSFLRAVLKRPNPMLANQRLEALRRIAVLGWRYGYTVPSHEVSALLKAGFTPRQYEALIDAIEAFKSGSSPAFGA